MAACRESTPYTLLDIEVDGGRLRMTVDLSLKPPLFALCGPDGAMEFSPQEVRALRSAFRAAHNVARIMH
jgi:hypothetical protein